MTVHAIGQIGRLIVCFVILMDIFIEMQDFAQ